MRVGRYNKKRKEAVVCSNKERKNKKEEIKAIRANIIILLNNKEEKIQYHITGRNKCESERISENQWDNIGSTTLLTNNNGDDIGQFLYTPFGEFWVEEASEVDISHITRFFTNQQYDKESGLYYMNARYYDPHLGSFITPDPGKEDFNHYNYCRSNPIRYTDPTGLAIYEMINEVYFEFDLFNVVISTGSYHSFIFCIPDKPEDFADYFQQAKQEDRYRTYELDGKQIEGFVLRAGPENEKVDPNVNLDKDKPTQSPIIHELNKDREKDDTALIQDLINKNQNYIDNLKNYKDSMPDYHNQRLGNHRKDEFNSNGWISGLKNSVGIKDNYDPNKLGYDTPGYNKPIDSQFYDRNLGLSNHVHFNNINKNNNNNNSSSSNEGESSISVICTELYKKGLIDDITYKSDEIFGQHLRKNNSNVIIGYHFIAKPIVKLMKESDTITYIVSKIALPWAEEMAYQMNTKEKGNFIGKIIMIIGIPFCSIIGCFINNRDNMTLIIFLIILFMLIYFKFINNNKKRILIRKVNHFYYLNKYEE